MLRTLDKGGYMRILLVGGGNQPGSSDQQHLGVRELADPSLTDRRLDGDVSGARWELGKMRDGLSWLPLRR